MLYIPRESSFISTQFFIVNLDGLFVVFSKNVLLFYIPLLHYLIYLASSIISCLSSGDTYLSSGIYLLLLTVSEIFCNEFLGFFVNLLAILLPLKSPITFAVFWIALFEAVVLSASAADYVAWSRSFWLYLLFMFLLILLPMFFAIFFFFFIKRQISVTFYKYSASRLNWIAWDF